jgi:2-iminobutanoate/2-iminopropanoate deaminase
VGAGGVAPLVFLSDSGPHALERVRQQLAQRDLRLADLLRLRLFTADRANAADIEQALERLLPRREWPAITIVELPGGDGQAQALDAVAAPRAHEQRTAAGDRNDNLPGAMRGLNRRPEAASDRHNRPEAVRFGPWVFVGALTGSSSTGLPLGERIDLESRNLFARMERVLHAAGAELRDVVKVGGWLRFPMSEYEPLGKVRNELLEQCGLFPASAAVQVGAIAGDRAALDERVQHPNEEPPGGVEHPNEEPLLAFEAIAFAPQEGLPRARASPLAPYYATARRAGGYVFTCGEIPRQAAPVSRQVIDVCEQLVNHLCEHGASPADVVHQTLFVRRSEDVPAIEREMRAFLGPANTPTTVVPAADLGFRSGVDVEIELVAEASRRARRD